MKIAIVDYGMGNIRSVSTTLQYLGVQEVLYSDDYENLKTAEKIILPGVGSFAKAMSQINSKKLDKILKELVLESGKPILGICLGMQLMGLSSTEEGLNAGLGLVNAKVEKFPGTTGLPIPHVGFNQVSVPVASRLYSEMTGSPDFYFTHSYRMVTEEDICQGTCDYEGQFVASFEVNNIAGVQFHPELSQTNGLQLLRNFINRF